MLVRDALLDCDMSGDVRFVEDGEAVLDYLRRRGSYAGSGAAPRPNLILLDLNMPKKDGRETLKEIKADPALRHFPVLVLTTSRAPEDVSNSYDLGANSFIIKPPTYTGWVQLMQSLADYWFRQVVVPRKPRGD